MILENGFLHLFFCGKNRPGKRVWSGKVVRKPRLNDQPGRENSGILFRLPPGFHN